MTEKNEESFERIAKIYDQLFPTAPKDTRKEIKALKKLLEERNIPIEYSIIVDLGGGTGRLAIPLSKDCKKVVLVDPFEQMIQIAKDKLVKNSHGEIEYRQEGFLDLSLPSNFADVIISFGGAFQSLLDIDEQITALSRIYNVLKPGGFLLLDLQNFFKLIKNYKKPELVKWETDTHKYSRIINHENYPHQETWVHKEQITLEEKSTGELEQIESVHRLKMISHTEMELHFRQAGFKQIKIYSGPDLDVEDGTRIWVTGVKPK